MNYETIQDRARLKAAHDIAVMEYAQGWEAMLTLRTGRQCEAELIRSLTIYRCIGLSTYTEIRTIYTHTLLSHTSTSRAQLLRLTLRS